MSPEFDRATIDRQEHPIPYGLIRGENPELERSFRAWILERRALREERRDDGEGRKIDLSGIPQLLLRCVSPRTWLRAMDDALFRGVRKSRR